jgi:hypothetical protein
MHHQYDMSSAHNQEYQLPYVNNIQMPYEENIHYRMDDYDHHMKMHDFCKKYKHYYVMLEMDDGKMYDGIIEKADNDQVSLLMPIGDQREEEEERQYDFGGYGYPYGGFGYPYGGYGPGYGFHVPFRFRRFRRFRFPFFRIRRFLFPFFY